MGVGSGSFAHQVDSLLPRTASMPKYPIGCETKDTSVIYTRKGIKYGVIYLIAPCRV